MKIQKLFPLLLIFFATNIAWGQQAKTSTISFPTSAVCDECKERIETKLNYTKGVIYAELDVETKILTVKFKPTVISSQEIKEILASIGYSSDTVQRDSAAFEALPKCCKGTEICSPKK